MWFVKSLSCGKEERENPQIKLHGLVCGFIEDFTWSPWSVIFQEENGDLSLCRKSYLLKSNNQFRLVNILIIQCIKLKKGRPFAKNRLERRKRRKSLYSQKMLIFCKKPFLSGMSLDKPYQIWDFYKGSLISFQKMTPHLEDKIF